MGHRIRVRCPANRNPNSDDPDSILQQQNLVQTVRCYHHAFICHISNGGSILPVSASLSSSISSSDGGFHRPYPYRAGLWAFDPTVTGAFRRSSPTSLSLSPSIPDLGRVSTVPLRSRSPPASADLSPSVPAFDRAPLYPRPGRTGFSPSVPGFDWGFCRLSPTSASPSTSIPDLFRPVTVSLQRSLGLSSPSVDKLVAVHLQLRRGFSPSVAILGRPPAVRPGLDRDSRRSSPAPTTLLVLPAVDRGFYSSSQTLAGLTPSASDSDQACRCPSPALIGVFAVRPDTGQTSGGSSRP